MTSGYVYMVTIDGTSHGDYENCAYSRLFSTADEAVDFVRKDLEECVANTVFVGAKYSDAEIACAIEKYCRFYGKYVQFRYRDAVMDYKIERTAVPEIKEK